MAGINRNAFVWGVSTAAYQIEGAAALDGRGPSIWDTFAHTPGAVLGGDTGDVACDHYHRYLEDVSLIRDLGAGAYRFSLSWSRLFPEGVGAPNPAGFDFYDRLIDSLLEAGVSPWACLYHWDLPQALQDRGGWPNRDSAAWYADYAAAAARRFGDRVDAWATFNEPGAFTLSGYGAGVHAPGLKDPQQMLGAIVNVNRAHGLGCQALRADAMGGVGVIWAVWPMRAETDSGADAAAAMFADALFNRSFPEPMAHGRYAEPLHSMLEGLLAPGDAELARQPLDYIGVNHYAPMYIRFDPEAGQAMGEPPAGSPVTGMGWHVEPEAFAAVLREVSERYGVAPIYVTENGAGYEEPPGPEGLRDTPRVEYFRQYLKALAAVRAEGVDVRGYFAWSLLDNFEWAEGYRKRFGLVRVDFDTQRRTPKASFEYLRNVFAGGPPAAERL